MDVDRVARRRHERRVAGLDERPHQVDEPLLGAHRRDDLGLGVERRRRTGAGRGRRTRPAASGSPATSSSGGCAASRRPPGASPTATSGEGRSGLPNPRSTTSSPRAPKLERELADHREHVRREAVEAAEGVGHRASTVSSRRPRPPTSSVTGPSWTSATSAAGASRRSPTRSRVFSPAKYLADFQSNPSAAAADVAPSPGHPQGDRPRRLVQRREPRTEHDGEVPVLRRHERRGTQPRDGGEGDHRVEADEPCKPRVDRDCVAGRRDARARADDRRGIGELEGAVPVEDPHRGR